VSLSRRGESLESEQDSNANIYLSKVLLFSDDIQTIALKLKDSSESAININCLNTIGMYPIIAKVETPLGTLCMSVWLISNEARFELFRTAYYSGVCHSIIITRNHSDLELVSSLVTLAPKDIPITFVSLGEGEVFDRELVDRAISLVNPPEMPQSLFFNQINSLEDISTVFNAIGQKIARDIRSGEFHTFVSDTSKPVNVYKLYNKSVFEKIRDLIGKIGYELLPEGIVIVHDKKFTYEVDFYRNQVKANISQCIHCPKPCKYYRKLCVLEEKRGYSNYLHFDNLQALAVLYALHDGSFYQLKGERPTEDIAFQLNRLWSLYETHCPFLLDEGELYERQAQSKKKRQRRRGSG